MAHLIAPLPRFVSDTTNSNPDGFLKPGRHPSDIAQGSVSTATQARHGWNLPVARLSVVYEQNVGLLLIVLSEFFFRQV